MARNPLTRKRPEQPPATPSRALPILFAAATVIAIGIPWLASTLGRSEPVRVVMPGGELPAPDPAVAPPSDATVVTPSAAPPRPFLDPSGAGAVAYGAGDLDAALAQYRAAIERNPQDAEAHSNLGQVLVRLKQPAEALPHFDRAIDLIPDRWAYHFNRARAFAVMERWDEAIAGYTRAQQLFPEDYATAFNLGQALHRKGDEAAAVDQYLRAITLNPADATFRLALGTSYERLQKNAEAAAAYAEYLRLAPDAADAEKVRARIAQLTGTS